MISLSKITPYLDSNLHTLLVSQEPNDWIGILSKTKSADAVAALALAIMKTPDWSKSKNLPALLHNSYRFVTKNMESLLLHTVVDLAQAIMKTPDWSKPKNLPALLHNSCGFLTKNIKSLPLQTVVDLAQTVTQTPDWPNKQDLRILLGNSCLFLQRYNKENVLSGPNLEVYKRVKALYKHKLLDSTTTTPPKKSPTQTQEPIQPLLPSTILAPIPLAPTLGIQNLGATCWMNTLLQHMRYTHDFDSILNGAIHNHANDNERTRLQELQQMLSTIIRDLRADQMGLISKERLALLVNKFAECNIITRADQQQDATEVLARLFSRLGNEPAGVQINEVKRFNDGFEEKRERAENNAILSLKVNHPNQTTSQLLDAEFAQEQLSYVNFVVRDAANQQIARYDGGKYLTTAAEIVGKEASEEAKRAIQVAQIQNGLQNQYGPVDVEIVPLEYRQKKIASLPPMVETRLNRISNDVPNIQQQIDLGNWHKDGGHALYNLESVMCRSGINSSNSGGHFWYYRKVGTEWKMFNDLKVTQPSPEEVQKDFNNHAYACFYYKQ